jgi:hypothetical protein
MRKYDILTSDKILLQEKGQPRVTCELIKRAINLPPDYKSEPENPDSKYVPKLMISNEHGCVEWNDVNITGIDFSDIINIE